MNLMKLAARGPAPWASEPPSQQRQPLRAQPGGPASRPVPPPTCSVTVVTCVPSKLQRGLQTLCGQVWSCRPATPLSTDSRPPEPLPPFRCSGCEALVPLLLPLGCPS